MTYEVRWDSTARDFLRKLSPEDAQRIVKKVNSITDFPSHYLEELVELNSYIGHRKNVYDRI